MLKDELNWLFLLLQLQIVAVVASNSWRCIKLFISNFWISQTWTLNLLPQGKRHLLFTTSSLFLFLINILSATATLHNHLFSILTVTVSKFKYLFFFQSLFYSLHTLFTHLTWITTLFTIIIYWGWIVNWYFINVKSSSKTDEYQLVLRCRLSGNFLH